MLNKSFVDISQGFVENRPSTVAKTLLPAYYGQLISRNIIEFEMQFLPHDWRDSFPKGCDISRHLFTAHTNFRWLSLGLPMFSLTEDALAGLLLTDPSNVSPEEIIAPFSTFCVELPERFFFIGEQSAKYLWYHRFESFNSAKESTISEALKTNKREDSFFIQFSSPNRHTVYEKREAIELHSDIKLWLEDVQYEFQFSDTSTINQDDKWIMRSARRLFINLCLFISETGRGTLRKRSRSYTRRAKEEEGLFDVWILGKEVKLDKRLIDIAKRCDDEDPEKRKEGWRLSKRFVVRGHWRNQVCGPARVDRKRIQIKPFWKGPKDGEKLSHLYTTGQ